MNEGYQSPLESRYASPKMRAIWSPQRKFTTWRRLWLALAEAEQELGLAISDAQIEELQAGESWKHGGADEDEPPT